MHRWNDASCCTNCDKGCNLFFWSALTLYTCFLFCIASIRYVFGQRGNPDSSAFQILGGLSQRSCNWRNSPNPLYHAASISGVHEYARDICKDSSSRTESSGCRQRKAYHQSFPGQFSQKGFSRPSLFRIFFTVKHNCSRVRPYPMSAIWSDHCTSILSSAGVSIVAGPLRLLQTFPTTWSWRVLRGMPYSDCALRSRFLILSIAVLNSSAEYEVCTGALCCYLTVGKHIS